MKKKQKKKNDKKKTKACPVSTMSISSTGAEPMGGNLEPLSQSTPSSQTRGKKVDLCDEEGFWCKGIEELAISGQGSLAEALCKKIDTLGFSGPGNHLNENDYHAWCIDDKGLVCDYMTPQLVKNSDYGTDDIIRRPFTAHVIPQRLVQCDKMYDEFLQGRAAEWGSGDVESTKKILLHIIDTPLFPSKNCYIRAKLLHESDPQKYSLVIGSLGFRQADGRIYWEYG